MSNTEYTNEKPLRLLHLFSGIGAPESALRNLKIPFEVTAFAEIDKYAIQSYRAIYGEDLTNLGDISKIDKLPICDLLFYGFCCQDISAAGKQKGLIDENGNQTRSGLLFDVLRLVKTAKENNEAPKILIAENVKNLVGKKFRKDFDNLLLALDSLGYNSYWKVLNAKDYLTPQNRERVFVVSIRKDIDKKDFEFPQPVPLKKRLKDVLEKNVDEKYYLSDDKVAKFIRTLDLKSDAKSKVETCFALKKGEEFERFTDTACTLMARDYKGLGNYRGNAVIENIHIDEPVIGASRGRNPENPSDRTTGSPTEQRLEINTNGTSNCLTTVTKDNYVVEPKIQKVEGNLYPNSGDPQAGRVYKSDGISPALDTCSGGNRMPKIMENQSNIRIRKLTPRETWRLQAFKDEDFDKAQKSGISSTQLYKQAGNSICVSVLMALFFNLFRNSVGKVK